MRNQRTENDVVYIDSKDADLIVLSTMTHKSNVHIIRRTAGENDKNIQENFGSFEFVQFNIDALRSGWEQELMKDNQFENVNPIRLLNDLKHIKIVQLMPSADGGMPHTRPGNIICYPDISQLFSQTTLIHELWHIHQRNYKDLWFKTFKRLGWTMWEGKLPENLEKSRRYNPDTIDAPFWIFNEEWVPIPIFKDISRPNVADVEIWFYNVQKQYHIKRVPDEILSYFPGLPPSAYEHPREITAYLLSEPDKYKNSQGFKHLIESIGEISVVMNKNENQY
jgi:hypothetical protein